MTTADAPARDADPPGGGAHLALLGGRRPLAAQIGVLAFVIVPLLALVLAVPYAWGWGLSWVDVGLAAFWYTVTCLGATVGYHRYFTHRSFKAKRPLRIALAVAGSMAVQGPILHWVADHRRHHAFSDAEGDPHSPWRYGTSPVAVARGFWHAHVGWVLDRDLTNQRRFAKDLLADPALCRVHRQFGLWTAVTLAAPAVMGGLITWSWWGAVTAFVWAGLARVALLHHVTWSVNSVCHMIGDRPFAARDRSANFWPLAVLSMGESWHNLHHADPTSARHGVKPGQIDISARLIWIFEKLGWAYDVRWPAPERIARLTAGAAPAA
ncbi:acyl-CoA desaturase [Dactylosporangium aurantiacum]|uniref:Acyl-CoA desaturase n=1 Tax=Dactylosporangium aurantiacum TaxID=35754 RepID=A0A9Q9ID86_9ACTN|nr:acyl-CoA desaturase [Dactylosporangium aurantiacum]MDG6109554.1 acyl-CoA desaturase [Dactylosporangium aurantiacum]UWZ51289.1 acyl-CoA desaturase [Dactylosporangium aurantiacum]